MENIYIAITLGGFISGLGWLAFIIMAMFAWLFFGIIFFFCVKFILSINKSGEKFKSRSSDITKSTIRHNNIDGKGKNK